MTNYLASISFILIAFTFVDTDSVKKFQPNSVKEITSISATVGQIPCPIDLFEDVAMILWFKDSSSTPIYSYDARNINEEPRHQTMKNDWGLRLYFRVSHSSRRTPALIIRDMTLTDAGIYRCRIDYRSVPTVNYIYKLKIIQPPTHMEIQDASKFRPIADQQQQQTVSVGTGVTTNSDTNNDITYVGPYIEGQNVTIICSAYGGVPLPEVVWYRNGLLVDASYELVGSNYATNELSIIQLERNHSHDLYTCQASNNNETKPISHRVNLDVYLTVKHIEVEIPAQMTAGVEYNIVCKAAGAYPTVRMEFWKLQRRIGPRYQIRSDADNVTSHSILFKPEITDDGTVITCKCDNPWISKHFMETGRQLQVVYAPVVVLRFGSSKTANFSEGESVLMECHVKANPQHHTIMWFFQNEEMTGNEPSIQIKGMTLMIQQLVHTSGGFYHCEAVNDIGKGISNLLYLQLNFTPKCATMNNAKIPSSIGDLHNLTCDVLAWPPDVNFYWTVNRSGDVLPLSHVRQTITTKLDESTESLHLRNNYWNSSRLFHKSYLVHGTGGVITGTPGRRHGLYDFKPSHIRHQAILPYSINSSHAFGTVIGCWAKNSHGQQTRPCLFEIVRRNDFKPPGADTVFPLNELEQNQVNLNPEDATHSIINEDLDLNEEKETFLSKLHGTYGNFGIIFLGAVLIFITCLCLLGTTWCFISSTTTRQTTATDPRQSTSTASTSSGHSRRHEGKKKTQPPIAKIESQESL